MGTLVAMHYGIDIVGVSGVADHTYVKCGTGKVAWGCFGGKSGGSTLRDGTGSTRRANSIAGSHETANINCYLLTGVCHQAANRILFPAGITVRGARGYGISQALYGTYGRTKFLFWCDSEFHRHRHVTGDLSECIPEPTVSTEDVRHRSSTEESYWRYIIEELELYEQADWQWSDVLSDRLFTHMIRFLLGPILNDNLENRLREVRRGIERQLHELMEGARELSLAFVESLNRLTIIFQHQIAEVLSPCEYRLLFDLWPGDDIILADPNIIGETLG